MSTLLIVGAEATSRVYLSTVLDSNGAPCFLMENKLAVKFAAIEVSESTRRKSTLVWGAPGQGDFSEVMVMPGKCVLYGEQLFKSPHRMSAQSLDYAKDYEVSINAFVKKRGNWQNRRYVAHFCLSRSADGKNRVRQLEWSKQRDGRDYSVCMDALAK